MASGKSLELAKIKPQPRTMCTCGTIYSEHMRKDGKGLLKRFDDGTHTAMIAPGNYMNRETRRRMQYGNNPA